MSVNFPVSRWHHYPADPAILAQVVQETGLSDLMAKVLYNRGNLTSFAVESHIDPEIADLPSPLTEFADLSKSILLLQEAIANGEKITICGDYDADGMTSTALLLRTFKHLNAQVNYVIPSRFKDGYGINKRIVEECAEDNTGLILTVDNGISAYDAVQRAIDLGLSVIITDHHAIPEKKPPADAILNPKLLRESSPYHSLAGVGVAYVLAYTLAETLGMLNTNLQNQLLELFTLGTIADLAPLTGVNRRWLKQGLSLIPHSTILGVQCLMKASGIDEVEKNLNPEDIGFKLGPRINAIGRIGDPQIVIELLTTDDPFIAQQKAQECNTKNTERQTLCNEIEQEAINLIEKTPIPWRKNRVLVIVQSGWHHGVIGIVASRLVERYGAPVFIATYEDNGTLIRGSARSIPEFNVSEALNYCQDCLAKYGGHHYAGGFSLSSLNWSKFEKKLAEFAHGCIEVHHLKPLIKIDAQADFSQLTPLLFQEIDQLQPWGVDNEFPVFWTPNVRIIEQKVVKGNHVRLQLQQNPDATFKAIAWRWGEYFPLPSPLDVAYKLRKNDWNNSVNLELELVSVRPCSNDSSPNTIFEYQNRKYLCSFSSSNYELRIKNDQGLVLVVIKGERTGLLGTSRENAKTVDITGKSPYYPIIKAAVSALNL